MSEPRAAPDRNPAFVRLWSGFLSARVLVALALLTLQLAGIALGQTVSLTLPAASGLYLLATLVVRATRQHSVPPPQPGVHWLATIGIDLLAYTGLQLLQAQTSDSMNYTPLYGFSVLMAGVLGTQVLALGTSAAATLLLLALAWWGGVRAGVDATTPALGAALTGTAYFIVAYLTHQLAARLLREQQHARQSQIAARTQEAVSHMVIEHVSDGVLVLDHLGSIRLANPAAQALLGRPARASVPFALAPDTRWAPLVQLVQATLTEVRAQSADVTILHEGRSTMGLRVRTWPTSAAGVGGIPEAQEPLCVMFLQDLRAMEAQLRTEKMAAMGRMSAAVAHEIRNPLTAIMQANQLLDEDLNDPEHKRLTGMVRQNAERLVRIAEDVLDIARVQHQIEGADTTALVLDATVHQIVHDWQAAHPGHTAPSLRLQAQATQVAFDPEHLRRVLVNLLDNARRYATAGADAVWVSTRGSDSGPATVQVWSDGAPLERTVERHLFDPFFSSESRSSGLGLYICRELCQRHGATLYYRRLNLKLPRGQVAGNAFTVTFRAPSRPADSASLFDTIVV